jgi:hypothetical protein
VVVVKEAKEEEELVAGELVVEEAKEEEELVAGELVVEEAKEEEAVLEVLVEEVPVEVE